MITDFVLGNSSDLMERVSILHFPPMPRDRKLRVADVTYGLGVFWRKIDTTEYDFYASDLKTVKGRRYDFRNLPYEHDFLDVEVMDPPWGAHKMYSHSHDFNRRTVDRYGTATIKASRNAADIMKLYRYGIREAQRVLRPGGLLCVKCQDGINAGKQFRFADEIKDWAVKRLGFEDVDKFYLFYPGFRALVHPVQRHARKTISVMWVFRK